MPRRGEHGRGCECASCVKARVAAFLERINDTSRMAPENLGQTVPVRAHWRRHPGHLKKMPKTKALLKEQLTRLIRKAGGE